jgi:hypothetical protein
MKTLKILSAVVILGSALPVVFVTSQGLYYDSIVVVDPLPAKGRFQQLIPGENGLMTEYGPGEVGHLGGRWWIDVAILVVAGGLM